MYVEHIMHIYLGNWLDQIRLSSPVNSTDQQRSDLTWPACKLVGLNLCNLKLNRFAVNWSLDVHPRLTSNLTWPLRIWPAELEELAL